MSFSESERTILARYYDKTRLAGGAKAGYLLRADVLKADGGGEVVEAGLVALAEKGLLQRTEAGDRYMLTEEGAELVAQGPPA